MRGGTSARSMGFHSPRLWNVTSSSVRPSTCDAVHPWWRKLTSAVMPRSWNVLLTPSPVARAAARVGLVGLGQRAVGEDHAEGVDLGIGLPDAVERRLHELARRDLAGGHEARLLGGAGVAEVGGVHGAAEH